MVDDQDRCGWVNVSSGTKDRKAAVASCLMNFFKFSQCFDAVGWAAGRASGP